MKSRAYDITKTVQDLRYLDFEELTQPSGAHGRILQAREGTGANAVYYKLGSYNEKSGSFGAEPFNELICARLAKLLGIPHAKYHLTYATISLGDRETTTWLVRSKSFRGAGETKCSFGLWSEAARQSGELPIDLCTRMGLRTQAEQMIVFDFLIANGGRTEDNVEVMRRADGTLSLAPLFSNGRSLLETCSSSRGTKMTVNPLFDVVAENCFGGTSLEENLKFVEGRPFSHMLKPDDHDTLLLGLDDILPDADRAAIWAIIWARWERYASLCHL